MYDIGFEPCLEPPEYAVPECPVCGCECDYWFRNISLEVIACDNCMNDGEEFDSVIDAWEVVADMRYW